MSVDSAKGLAVTGAAGHDFHDPAGADPGLADVLWSLSGAQHPGDVAAMAKLAVCCYKRDFALTLELTAYLVVQRLLVALDRQQEVGPWSWSCRKTGAGYGVLLPG